MQRRWETQKSSIYVRKIEKHIEYKFHNMFILQVDFPKRCLDKGNVVMGQPTVENVDADWLASICTKHDPQAIAAAVSQNIGSFGLVAGARLPTVRAMAQRIGVSASTVAAAWALLRDNGMVETHRRGGTQIKGVRAVAGAGTGRLDISRAMPDPALQPDLREAMMAGLHSQKLHSADLDYVMPSLRRCVETQWTFQSDDWMIVGASSESILVSVSAVTTRGDKIAIEQPTTPRLLRVLNRLGLIPIAVRWDLDGPRSEDLLNALQNGAVAFVYQPRAHTPLGLSVTEVRAKQLADILSGFPQAAVIEDEPLGPVVAGGGVSIGRWLPERTILVRSYCKAFGLDLRTSVIGGGARHIAAIREKRSMGLGVASRILQGALLHLLSAPSAITATTKSQEEYKRRRVLLITALQGHGIEVSQGGEGLVVWIKVKDELSATIRLAEQGLIVGRGEHYFVDQSDGFIALSIGQVPEPEVSMEWIAETVTKVVSINPSRDHGVWD